MGDEAEDIYESEGEYYENDDDDDSDDESEEETEETADVDDDLLDNDYDADTSSVQNMQVVKKLKQQDNNHRIVKIVPRDKYKSSHIIQFTELVEAIGQRISQIEAQAPVYTDVTGYKSSIDMAKKEFIDRRSPLILVRKRRESDNGDYEVEEWKVREMTFPVTDKEILNITEKMISTLIDTKK